MGGALSHPDGKLLGGKDEAPHGNLNAVPAGGGPGRRAVPAPVGSCGGRDAESEALAKKTPREGIALEAL